MKLEIKQKAKKDFRKLSKNEIEKILDKIDLYCEGNTSNIKKLTNHKPEYRLRVGDYKVLFDIYNNTMIVRSIQHRKEAYK